MSSQKGENKRVVKKSKNKNKVNIKVSTGDPDAIENCKEGKKDKISSQTTKRSVEKSKKEKLNDLISQTNTLTEKLEDIKKDIINEKQEVIDEVQTLNDEINSKTNECNELAKKNTKLISQLKNIEKEIDDKFKSVNVNKIKQKKELSIEEQEEKYNKQLKIIEKRMKNEAKFSNNYKKEIERYENLLKQSDTNPEETLNEELEELNEKISNLKEEISNLKNMKNEHQNCQKYLSSLQSKLNLIANDYQFETKKINMIKSSYFPYVKEESKLNKNKEYTDKVRNLSTKKTNSIKNGITTTTYGYIQNEFENLNKNNNYFKTYENGYLEMVDEINDNNKRYLFNNRESEILKKLLPGYYLSRISGKYDNVEAQINEIEEKFKENKGLKEEIVNKKNKIDFSRLQLKEQEKKISNLNIEVSKYKRQIVEIKLKISKINTQLKSEAKILSKKESENKVLNNHIIEAQNKKTEKKENKK